MFKVGMVIQREGYFDRRIDFIGKSKYFYTMLDKKDKLIKGVESCCSLEFIHKWEEKETVMPWPEHLGKDMSIKIGKGYIGDGVPCSHNGCLNHVTKPCEGCGRINGVKK